MSYLVIHPKSKKEQTFLKNLIDKLNIEYQEVTIQEYVRDISESRQQIKKGKKITLTSLLNGL